MSINYAQFLPQPPNFENLEVGPQGFFFDVYGTETPPLVNASNAQPEDATLINNTPASIMSRVQTSRRKRGVGTIQDHAVTFLFPKPSSNGGFIFFTGNAWASDLP